MPLLGITLGEHEIIVRRAKVGHGRVGVEMLAERLTQVDRRRIAPAQKVGAGRHGHCANFVREDSVVAAIQFQVRVPKREVLRVERPLGKHRLVAEQPPVHAVGRGIGGEPLGTRRRLVTVERLVKLIARHARPRVFEGGEVMRRIAPNDVVLLGALKLEQAQLRSREQPAVTALGEAGEADPLFFRAQLGPAAINHPHLVMVTEHRDIGRVLPFPRRVELEHHLGLARLVQSQLDIALRGDLPRVDEQFPFAPLLVHHRLGAQSSGRSERGDGREHDSPQA